MCFDFIVPLPPLPLPSPPPCLLRFEDGGKLVLIIFSLIGFFTFDMIYVTAVMNYAAQSEMLVYLLKSVSGLVEQKGYNGVDEAIKVMFLVRTVETSSYPDTNGTGESVHISEVSLFQGLQELFLGKGKGVLIPGVS